MNRHLAHILSALALSLAAVTAWADDNRGSDNNSSTDNTITIRPSILLMKGREEKVFSSSTLSD